MTEMRCEGSISESSKKLRKGTCLKNVKKFTFPYKGGDTWNEFIKNSIEAGSIHIIRKS